METLGETQAQRNGQLEDTAVTNLGHMLKWLKCGQSHRERQSSPKEMPTSACGGRTLTSIFVFKDFQNKVP